MIEEKYFYAEEIAYEDSGMADKVEWEMAEHQFTVKEACDELNKLDRIIQEVDIELDKIEEEYNTAIVLDEVSMEVINILDRIRNVIDYE